MSLLANNILKTAVDLNPQSKTTLGAAASPGSPVNAQYNSATLEVNQTHHEILVTGRRGAVRSLPLLFYCAKLNEVGGCFCFQVHAASNTQKVNTEYNTRG